MKKIIGLLAVMLGAGVVCAQQQQLTFLTVLSQPVASFNELDVADTQQYARARSVTFGTNHTSGSIELVGPILPNLSSITLRPDTTLKSATVVSYGLNSLTMRPRSRLDIGRLFAFTVARSENTNHDLVVGVTSNLPPPEVGDRGFMSAPILYLNGGASSLLPPTAKVGKVGSFLCIRGNGVGENKDCNTLNADSWIQLSRGGSGSQSVSWQTTPATKTELDPQTESRGWSDDPYSDSPFVTTKLLRSNSN